MRVLVAGAGIAGIEGLLALRDLAGDRVEASLLAPDDHFHYRPFAIAEPFGLGRARTLPLADVARDLGVRWTRGDLADVDEARGRVRTADGAELDYDALLIAVGGRPVAGVEHALTWAPEGDQDVFGGLLRDVEEGYVKRVAFVAPPGAVWPLPIYELALMTARDAEDMGMDVSVVVFTPERAPLAFLGEEAEAALRDELDRAGIALRTGVVADVGRSPTLHVTAGGGPIEVDRVVAVPRVLGPAITGIPADEDGFVRVEHDGRVQGAERTWAAGDGVAFPIKFGGLATQQAVRAATAIARRAGADAPDPEPLVLRGVLMTGEAPRKLGAEGGRRGHTPLWWPAGKVAGRYLPEFIGERDDPPAPPPSADGAVHVEQRVELSGPGAEWLYDATRPLGQAGGRAIGDLGHRMQSERRKLEGGR